MQKLIIYLFLQNILLLLLLAKDKNEGERELFRSQQWTASNVVFLVFPMTMFILTLYLFVYYLSRLMNTDLIVYANKYYPFLILSFTTVLLIFIFRSKKQAIIALGVKREDCRKNIIIGISISFLSYAALTVIFLCIKNVRPDFHFRSFWEVKTLLSSSLTFSIYFFTIVFWSPIVEESIYRGILYSPYRKKYGPKLAIIITSLLFSLIHFEDAPGAFLKGILWGILYEKTESILPPMVAHSGHNLLSFLTEVYLLK